MVDHGRHTVKAVIAYQEAGERMAKVSRDYIGNIDQYYAVLYQRLSQIEYATARKLMNIEGNENA